MRHDAGVVVRRRNEALVELAPGAEVELADGVAQVELGGGLGHEASLGDLAVREAGRGQARDAVFTRGERVQPVLVTALVAGTSTGRDELLAGTPGVRCRAARGRSLEPVTQRFACLRGTPEAAEGSAELDEHPGVLKPRLRPGEGADGVAEQNEPLLAAAGDPRRDQGDAAALREKRNPDQTDGRLPTSSGQVGVPLDHDSAHRIWSTARGDLTS